MGLANNDSNLFIILSKSIYMRFEGKLLYWPQSIDQYYFDLLSAKYY